MLLPYRKYITSSVGFSFVVVGITGLIFKLFFKSHLLEEIHGWLGMVMVAAAVLHIIQNLRPIKNYLGDRKVLWLTAPVIIFILAMTFFQNDAERGVASGEMARKLAQASAADVAKVFGKDVSVVFLRMQADGLKAATAEQSITAIAKDNERPEGKILSYFVR